MTKRTNAAENMAKGGEEGEVRTTLTSYAGQENLGWKLHKPTSVTADPGGLGLEHTTLYELETGNIIETRQPANAKEKSAHATETTYYTAGANAKAEVCGEHPEWADLPCQTRPAKQPETAGLPSLTVTTITKYNIWDEPETTEETAGRKTRTKTETYDAAGRLTSSSSTISSTWGRRTTDRHLRIQPRKRGARTQARQRRQDRSITAATTRSVSSRYTDADGNTTTYEYDIDGRIHKINDGKGTQTYSYNETTGGQTNSWTPPHEADVHRDLRRSKATCSARATPTA